MQDIRLVIFDLDGTLAESKSPLDTEMGELVAHLLFHCQVAVISGCRFEQFQRQFLPAVPRKAILERLYLYPTCGASFYRHQDGVWIKVYDNALESEEKDRIFKAFTRALTEYGHQPEQVWGEMLEDRQCQITFSALGQEAPLEAKATWDPDQRKRADIIELLKRDILDYDIKYGGATSIDVTRKGIDKAYGIRSMQQGLGIPLERMLFVGDSLEPGGNDHAVLSTGISYRVVRDPEETKEVIRSLCANNHG